MNPGSQGHNHTQCHPACVWEVTVGALIADRVRQCFGYCNVSILHYNDGSNPEVDERLAQQGLPVKAAVWHGSAPLHSVLTLSLSV